MAKNPSVFVFVFFCVEKLLWKKLNFGKKPSFYRKNPFFVETDEFYGKKLTENGFIEKRI